MEIKTCTFYQCKNLQEVVFEEGSKLKTIGNWVFDGCSNLAKINLPEGLNSIGCNVFFKCTSLKNIQLPSGLEKIGTECFAQSSIEQIVFPASVKEVGIGAFQYCE